jgi:hypothetical protein
MDKPDMRGMHVYIAGPMEGRNDYNRAAFNMAEGILNELGATVWNPAKLRDLFRTDGREACMRMNLRHLVGDSPRVDLLVLLPGWEDSQGARCEQMAAAQCGIECVEISEVGE